MKLIDRILGRAVALLDKTRAGSRLLDESFSQRLAATGLAPIGETAPDDIFIAGYPKSGNTWMQNLLSGVAFGLDASLVSDSLVQDLVPDVHAKGFYRRYREPMFFKTHWLPRPEYRRVIYLLRDGRDVTVSYYHHLQAAGSPYSLSDLVEHGSGLFPCRWHEHVEAWAENPYDAEVLTVRYEDLKAAPLTELRRICDFARDQFSDQRLLKAIESSSFASMRAKEKRWGWDKARHWPTNRLFVRRGEVGSYRDEMPGPIQEAFLKIARNALQTNNYLEAESFPEMRAALRAAG